MTNKMLKVMAVIVTVSSMVALFVLFTKGGDVYATAATEEGKSLSTANSAFDIKDEPVPTNTTNAFDVKNSTSNNGGQSPNTATDDYVPNPNDDNDNDDPYSVKDEYENQNDDDEDDDDNCEDTGAYGQTCIYNKSFKVTKYVRIQGDDEWEDKVVDVQEDEVVEFKIKVKNVGEVEVDDMKMEDFLPDEMERVGGSGLTEYWNDFEPGETKTFVIEAEVNDSEYDAENFEKCVVNKVEIEYDGDFEGSDTATVCYGDVEITELPSTGATSTIALTVAGFGFMIFGALVKKRLI